MTYKQIETSREIRLWITGIIGPIVIGGATLLASDPELRQTFRSWLKDTMNRIKNKFKKRKEA